jgi:hypothetical protein
MIAAIAFVENMMLNDRVNRLRISAALGSRSVAGILNLGDRCSNMWYRGSRGEHEKSRRIWGASIALSDGVLMPGC